MVEGSRLLTDGTSRFRHVMSRFVKASRTKNSRVSEKKGRAGKQRPLADAMVVSGRYILETTGEASLVLVLNDKTIRLWLWFYGSMDRTSQLGTSK